MACFSMWDQMPTGGGRRRKLRPRNMQQQSSQSNEVCSSVAGTTEKRNMSLNPKSHCTKSNESSVIALSCTYQALCGVLSSMLASLKIKATSPAVSQWAGSRTGVSKTHVCLLRGIMERREASVALRWHASGHPEGQASTGTAHAVRSQQHIWELGSHHPCNVNAL